MNQESVVLDSLGQARFIDSNLLTTFSRAFQSTSTDPIDIILASPHSLSNMEINTWKLIYDCLDPLVTAQPHPQIASLSTLLNTGSLSSHMIVKTWLEKTAPYPQALIARPAYLKTTVKDIRGAAPRTTLVNQIDPDAAGSRQRGKTVSNDDADYQGQLYQAVFGLLRVGEIGRATEIAEKSHQAWLAAAIVGSIPQFDADLDGEGGDGWEKGGNANRHVWIGICLALAEGGSSDAYERALFSHFAGDSAGV
jgi:hypothetical protein